jgi:hypothetical protein
MGFKSSASTICGLHRCNSPRSRCSAVQMSGMARYLLSAIPSHETKKCREPPDGNITNVADYRGMYIELLLQKSTRPLYRADGSLNSTYSALPTVLSL